jgi:hypothetical protein
MPTTPAGSISLSAKYMRDMLADCPAFRTWCGADDATQALGRIHYDALPPADNHEEHTLEELKTHRPYALVYSRTLARGHLSTGIHHEFGLDGSMGVEFFQDVPAEIAHDPGEIALRFNNAIGAVIDELCDRAGLAGFLALTRITMEEPPVRTHENERADFGDALFVRLIMDWSDG